MLDYFGFDCCIFRHWQGGGVCVWVGGGGSRTCNQAITLALNRDLGLWNDLNSFCFLSKSFKRKVCVCVSVFGGFRHHRSGLPVSATTCADVVVDALHGDGGVGYSATLGVPHDTSDPTMHLRAATSTALFFPFFFTGWDLMFPGIRFDYIGYK